MDYREMLLDIAKSYPWGDITLQIGSENQFCGVYSCHQGGYARFHVSRIFDKALTDYNGNPIDRLDLTWENTPVLHYDWSGREMTEFSRREDYVLRDLAKFKAHRGGQLIEKIVREYLTPNSIRMIKNL